MGERARDKARGKGTNKSKNESEIKGKQNRTGSAQRATAGPSTRMAAQQPYFAQDDTALVEERAGAIRMTLK
jgi:hypothetical protein